MERAAEPSGWEHEDGESRSAVVRGHTLGEVESRETHKTG